MGTSLKGTYRALIPEGAADRCTACSRVRVGAVALVVVLAAAGVNARLAGREGCRAGVAVGTGGCRGERGNGEEQGGDGLHFGAWCC